MTFINKLGSVMAIFGILAIVMGFMNQVPIVLQWIYNWGETAAWAIKIALSVGGGLMWFLTRNQMANRELASSENSSENTEA